MSIVIRKAVKEDCPAMMELIHELAVYEKEPEAVTVSFDHFVESGFGEQPVWQAFVATSPLELPLVPLQGTPNGEGDEKTEVTVAPINASISAISSPPVGGGDRGGQDRDFVVVGFALYYIRYSTWKGQRLYLEDFLVSEKMRGKGIGKLLFDTLIEECKAKKYSGMVWQVLDWNEPAINFYKKYPEVSIDSGWLNCNINF